MASLIRIENTELPMPSGYDAQTGDIVESGRNAEATTVGQVIREDVAKIELSWKFLTVEQWSMILKLLQTKYGGKFVNNIYFFNQTSGQFETRKFYPGNRKASLFRIDKDGNIVGWLDCKVNFIEV